MTRASVRRRAAAKLPLGAASAAGSGPRVRPVELAEVTEDRYRTYALSVITARALPDVRDGLKPVQRRILVAMWRKGLRPGGRFAKCAKVVGDVMGAYHPHGDSAIYEALVRLAQPFASRVPLVEGSGNFGSLDGDPPAAMRYTECRLPPVSEDILGDLASNTVDERPTYDGARTEPVVLPTRLPLLLVNGSSGIAVGVATQIPPHRPVEVLDALIALLDDPELGDDGLAERLPGPDFPTGGEILDPPERVAAIYRRGRGSIRVRGRVEEQGVRGRVRTIHITSVPYGVDKAQLVERLGALAADSSIPGLLGVSDLSTDDVRIRLETRKDIPLDRIVALLSKRTPLLASVPVDLTCLRFVQSPGGAPERVGVRTLLTDFLDFRRDVVRRRLADERRRLEARLHLLDGFLLVFDALDRILEIVRASSGKADAARRIRQELPLDAVQTDAILELRVYRLARLEIQVLVEEARKRKARLAEVEKLLGSTRRIAAEVRRELVEIRDRFRTRGPRRTRFASAPASDDFVEEDLLPDEEATVVLTRDGWIRRQREVRELEKLRLRDGDRVLAVEPGNTRAPVALFSSFGTAFTTQIAHVPASTGYGDPVQTLFALRDGERIVSLLSLDPRALGRAGRGRAPEQAVAVTRSGQALRFRLASFRAASKRPGRRYARLREDDSILGVALTNGEDTLTLVTEKGRVLLVDVEEINLLRGPGFGVRAIRLGVGDRVLGFSISVGKDLLTVKTTGGQLRNLQRGEEKGQFRIGTRGRAGKWVVKAGFAEVVGALVPPEPLG